MNDLKPCPFHKEVHYPIVDTGYDPHGEMHFAEATCPKCEIFITGTSRKSLDEAYSELLELWNTRYERTCKDKSVFHHNGWIMCSMCGGFTQVTNASENLSPRYCGKCGARVVNE